MDIKYEAYTITRTRNEDQSLTVSPPRTYYALPDRAPAKIGKRPVDVYIERRKVGGEWENSGIVYFFTPEKTTKTAVFQGYQKAAELEGYLDFWPECEVYFEDDRAMIERDGKRVALDITEFHRHFKVVE